MTENVKCVIVGDGAIGKTSVLMTCAGQSAFDSDYVPTVFDNYNHTILHRNKHVSLGLWDTLSSYDYSRLRPLSYPETDVVDEGSFSRLLTFWIPEILEHAPGVPYMIVGLKTDLRECENILKELEERGEKPITPLQGIRLAIQGKAWAYRECSSKQNKGVKEVFTTAMSLVFDDYKGKKKKKKKGGVFQGILGSIFGNTSSATRETADEDLKMFEGGKKEEFINRPLHGSFDPVCEIPIQFESGYQGKCIEQMKKDILERDVEEMRRLMNILDEDLKIAKTERKELGLDKLPRDVQLHILQRFILIDLRDYVPRDELDNEKRRSIYERRQEFKPYLSDLNMPKKNILTKCFGYFSEDKNFPNRRKIIQIFYHFIIDRKSKDDDLLPYEVRHGHYFNIYAEHIPKFLESLFVEKRQVFYFNNFYNHNNNGVQDIRKVILGSSYMEAIETRKKQLLGCEEATFDLYFFDDSKLRNVFQVINKSLPNLKSLCVSRKYYLDRNDNNDKSNQVDLRLPSLERLRFEGVQLVGTGLKFSYSQMKHLTLIGGRERRTDGILGKFKLSEDQWDGIYNLPNLTTLNLHKLILTSLESSIIKFVEGGDDNNNNLVDFRCWQCTYDYEVWKYCQVQNNKKLRFLFLYQSNSKKIRGEFVDNLKMLEQDRKDESFTFLILSKGKKLRPIHHSKSIDLKKILKEMEIGEKE